jgi:hypothetical protein
MPIYNVGDVCSQQPYDFMILRDDNNDYCVNEGKANQIVYKNAALHNAWNYCRDNRTAYGALVRFALNGTHFTSQTLEFNAALGTPAFYLSAKGMGQYLNTTIEATGNFPVFGIGNMSYWELSDMRLSHNFAGYNSNLLLLRDNTDHGLIERTYFHDAGNGKRGNGVGMINTGAGTSAWNRFNNCFFRSLNYANYVDSVGSATVGCWTNSNMWNECIVGGCNWWLKVNNKSGDSFSQNDFISIHNQTSTLAGTGGYDLDDAAQSDSSIKIIGGIDWDLEATAPMLKVGTKSKVTVVAHEPCYSGKISGSGYGNGARVVILSPDAQNGWLWDTVGDGINKDFNVTHNLGRTPDRVKLWKRSRDIAQIPMWVAETTSTVFTIRFATPPPPPSEAGIKNIVVEWLVEDIQ